MRPERVREARASLLFEDVPDHLARLDEPEERRECAELHRHRAGARQVVADPRQLTEHHPVPLPAVRNDEPAELLDCERVAHVVEHRRHVVEAVRVREDLRTSRARAIFLEAAVQIADPARRPSRSSRPIAREGTIRTVPCIAGCEGPRLRCIGSEGSSSSPSSSSMSIGSIDVLLGLVSLVRSCLLADEKRALGPTTGRDRRPSRAARRTIPSSSRNGDSFPSGRPRYFTRCGTGSAAACAAAPGSPSGSGCPSNSGCHQDASAAKVRMPAELHAHHVPHLTLEPVWPQPRCSY